MKVLRIILIVILLAAGLGLIMYPIYNKNKTAKKQDEMITDLEKQIKRNTKKDPNSNKEDQDDKKNTYNLELVKEEVRKLEIEENQGDINEGNTKELLKNQKVIGMINIPIIKAKYAIVEGSNRANIAVAIGHMKGTASLGGEGNCVLAGHNGGIYGKFFKNINHLKKDDEVLVTDQYGDVYTYKVYESFKVKPSDVYVVENLEGSILTLITCQDNGKNRLVVRCRR